MGCRCSSEEKKPVQTIRYNSNSKNDNNNSPKQHIINFNTVNNINISKAKSCDNKKINSRNKIGDNNNNINTNNLLNYTNNIRILKKSKNNNKYSINNLSKTNQNLIETKSEEEESNNNYNNNNQNKLNNNNNDETSSQNTQKSNIMKTIKILNFKKNRRLENNIKKQNNIHKMLQLLAKFIEAKTGIFINSTENETSLLAKGYSHKTLDNKIIDSINYSIKKITKVYKNQKYPKPNEHFTDDLFPPNLNSLMGLDKDGNPIDKIRPRLIKSRNDFIYDPDNIIWLRVKDIFINTNYNIFVDDICIDDVKQGNLGNCYFMSSLAAMTSFPQLIIQIFKTNKIPKNNCYEIGMNIEGEWKIVLLDDYFPCSKKTRMPIFAKPNGPELWSMLLEKAWAKINGGYLNITGGYASEVLSTLTSFPIQTIHLDFLKKDDIWDILINAFNQNQIISCCSKFHSEIEKYGLISGHSFTVINFTQGYLNNKWIRLIRLRNPWGYKQWNGDWSIHSELWTDIAKKVLCLENDLIINDDGAFWISLEDFFKYFCIVDICKVTDPQCVKNYKIGKDKVIYPNVFELQIFSKTNLFITVLKKNYRFHRTMESNYELAINVIIMKKTQGNNLIYINSVSDSEKNPFIEIDLTVGFYLIYVFCNYKSTNIEHIRKVNLYVSANKYFFLYYKDIDIKFNLLKLLIYNMYNKKNIRCNVFNEFDSWTSNKFENTTFGFLLIKNLSEKEIRLNVENKSKNFYIIYPFNDKTINVECIVPGNCCAVFVGVRKNYYDLYKFSLLVLSHNTPFSVPIISIIKKNNIDFKENFTINNHMKNKLLLRANFIQETNAINYYINKEDNKKFLINNYDKEIDEDEYNFLFKKIHFKFDNMIEKIDYKTNALKYFLKKYPKEMNLILNNVSSLHDGIEVIFKDVFDFGGTYYIGEWKIKEELCRHGRGLLVYSNGNSYLGQWMNDKEEGFGRFYYNRLEYININWKNGKMDGVGELNKSDGSKKIVVYKDGIKLSSDKKY